MYDGFYADSSYMSFLVEELVRQCPGGSVLSSVSLEHLRGLRNEPPPPLLGPTAGDTRL